jgi:hypothetical protein
MYYHTGLRYQRGAGFASLFSGLFKMLKPLASMGLKAGKQFIGSNFAKKAGSAMLDIGKKAAENMIVDVLEGANVKDSAVKQLDEAKTKIDNQLLSKEGNILIKEIVSEKINTVANHQVLNLLAKKTGGKLFYPEQLNLLEKEVLTNEQIKPITYSQNTTTLLIDLKWLFWLVIGLLAAEWLFRKRYTSI